MALPPFLNPIPFRNPVAVDGAALVPYTEARFRSERLALESHALWWGSRGVEPSTVLVVIPGQSVHCTLKRTSLYQLIGNPGLARFYTPFLSTLHQKCDGAIPIVISALVGHTPGINDEDPDFAPLLTQVEHFVQLVDAAAAVYGRVMLAGHSIGSWLTLQVGIVPLWEPNGASWNTTGAESTCRACRQRLLTLPNDSSYAHHSKRQSPISM